DDEDAIRLLKCTDKPVSVVEHSFSPAVMAYVLEHNFATDDLVDLISEYQQYDTDIQALIKQQVNEHIESVSIEQNTQALEFIRVYCDKEAVLDYLQKNIADYADLITEDTELFDYDETLQLVNLGLDDEDAIRLLKCTDKPVSVVEHSFLPAVMAYVLEHNFATDDLADLISKYQQYDADIQALIKKQVNEHIESVSIEQNTQALEFIRAYCDKEAVLDYLQKNIADYADLITEDTELFDYDEALKLITKPIDDNSAIRLLKCTDKPVSVVEHSFSPAVMAHVLENKFDTDDLADLISKYQQYDADIQALIKKQVNEHIESVSIEQNAQALEFIRVYCDKEAVLDYLQKNIADYADLITKDTDVIET
ncbi:hypothetical protein, partial [Snodgrassella alvi]|uniref:hypothetical protein n=1 Tax=Snodgrassella alvi TaxID=1196083 RepID=UPI0015D559A9